MNKQLVRRLASIASFSEIPQNELLWLVEHGHFKVYEVGTVVAPKGKPVKYLWIILSGNISIRVDRGVGAKLVTEWLAGQVTGMLPYSRMSGPPGDNYIKEKAETISIAVNLFPEMINKCPRFTAYTVHLMLDRARNFNTNALQDEKMISLGKLASGLAHELNNPASAAMRDAKLIKDELAGLDEASRALGAAGLTDSQISVIKTLYRTCLVWSDNQVMSPIEKADYQDKINTWLLQQGLDSAISLPLADTSVNIDALDKLVSQIPGTAVEIVLKWILASYTVHSLAQDMEHSAKQIYTLVDSVKKFTYMDNLADKEVVDVEQGIRDTLNVLISKAKSNGASITVEAEKNLPNVSAKGSELNQVWLSLIDNALDAIPNPGNIHISMRSELDRVEVRIIDNGLGIPQDKISHIFEAFFTTKPPGHGIGLGLDLARRILHRYNGEISVQSQSGRTEFLVSLIIHTIND